MEASTVKSLAQRLGSKTASNKPAKSGFNFDLVALCDSLQDSACLSLRDPIVALQSEQHQTFSSALTSLEFEINPAWSSREIELLIKGLLRSGATLEDLRIVSLIKTGRLSGYQLPSLVNEALKFGSLESLNTILAHVQDLDEADLTKIMIFCLSSDQDDTMQMLRDVLKRPFSRIRMMRCLKNFGTLQVEALMTILLGLLDSEHESLAFQWISVLIDAHYTIMLIQPAFLPLLKQLHEYIGRALVIDEIAETSTGLIQSVMQSKPSELVSNPLRKVITNDYMVERSIDL